MGTAEIINFPKFDDARDSLSVYECRKYVPFDILRVFTIRASGGETRGNHAHKKCTQLLVCVKGRIKVRCNNGADVTEFVLDDIGKGLLIPPGVWAAQEYCDDFSVLMVMCDRGYEADDYIREFGEFVAFAQGEEK
jgi:dTDP-4-dehydrorhamnose 3,5-epimerase-like enzyme